MEKKQIEERLEKISMSDWDRIKIAKEAFNLGIELAAENAKSISTYPSYRVDEDGDLVFHDVNKEDILKLKL